MHEAWIVYYSNEDYIGRFPNLMQLWQAVLTLSASTASCEGGFSTQNYIKSAVRSSLNLDTL